MFTFVVWTTIWRVYNSMQHHKNNIDSEWSLAVAFITVFLSDNCIIIISVQVIHFSIYINNIPTSVMVSRSFTKFTGNFSGNHVYELYKIITAVLRLFTFYLPIWPHMAFLNKQNQPNISVYFRKISIGKRHLLAIWYAILVDTACYLQVTVGDNVRRVKMRCSSPTKVNEMSTKTSFLVFNSTIWPLTSIALYKREILFLLSLMAGLSGSSC